MRIGKLFGELTGRSRSKAPIGKEGARAYAVGDVHGCLSLLGELLVKIEQDLAERPCKQAFLIFLGDLVDRGPDSAGAVERLRTYSHPGLRRVVLMGNHEEYFLRVLAGEPRVLEVWLNYGGKECVQSYGLDPAELLMLPEGQALRKVREAVPQTHREFLKSFADTFRFGDYLFVHAGIRPGLPIEEQVSADLRWIRDPFLSDEGDHGMVVVHGHTIVREVSERPNRIGIDTGAYRTGVLTALVVDGGQRQFLTTSPAIEAVPQAA